MPQCVTCRKYFPIDFVKSVNDKTGELQCFFCFFGKKELTVVDEKTNKETKITKKEVCDKYERFIKETYQSPKVQKLINPHRG